MWIYPRDYELPQMVDTFDKLRLMGDPQGPIAQRGMMGANRQMDVIIFDAFFADAKTGVDGSTTDAFDTTNHRVDAAIGASADTGMNVEKVLEARKILLNNEVDLDEEECHLAMTPELEHDLLRQEQVLSEDKKGTLGIRTNDKGRIIGFAGCTVHVSTKTPNNSSYTLCPMWVKSGMHLGIWSDIKARVDERADISGVPYQVYTTLTAAATRVEAGRVIQIECTE